MLPVLLTDTVTPDLDRALHYTLLWGLEGVVLRTIGGASDRVPHVNEERLRRRLDEAELPAVAADPGLFEGASSSRAAALNDLAALPETFAFCRRMGAPCIVVGALAGEDDDAWDAGAAARVLREAGDAAASVGLTLAVRNAAGTACASGERLAELLAATNHPAVGAAWSPAEAVAAGADPAAGLAALVESGAPLGLVYVRDLAAREGNAAPESGTWEEVLPGEGVVGWADQLAALVAASYEGPLVLEMRRRPAAQIGLKATAALVALVRAARRSRRP